MRLLLSRIKKTPAIWTQDGVNFISVADQLKSKFKLAKQLPFNHYSRKMLGYLEAISQGAEMIIDTDDDNIPYENYSFPDFEGSFQLIDSELGFVNIYEYFTDQKIWPRGLPLNLINKKTINQKKIRKQKVKVGVWQGLADNDPDVDAIYRLTSDTPCTFNKKEPVALNINTVCPFNTQNTAIRKELFPLLYLPSTVTFRYTDILRSFVAQPLMWLYGFHLGFSEATVYQERNPHDYFKDFISEIPMFLTSQKVIDILKNEIKPGLSLEENLIKSYKILFKEKIVEKDEINRLEAWLADLQLIK
jgi:hypothetical protein